MAKEMDTGGWQKIFSPMLERRHAEVITFVLVYHFSAVEPRSARPAHLAQCSLRLDAQLAQASVAMAPTLALIKPFAVSKGYGPAIEELIAKYSFAVLARAEVTLTAAQVRRRGETLRQTVTDRWTD